MGFHPAKRIEDECSQPTTTTSSFIKTYLLERFTVGVSFFVIILAESSLEGDSSLFRGRVRMTRISVLRVVCRRSDSCRRNLQTDQRSLDQNSYHDGVVGASAEIPSSRFCMNLGRDLKRNVQLAMYAFGLWQDKGFLSVGE